MKLDHLSLVPTDEKWKFKYTKEKESRRKLISVYNLSFSAYYVTDLDHHNQYYHKKNSIKKAIQRNTTQNNFENDSLREKNYILHPMRFQVKVELNNVVNTDHLSTPEVNLDFQMQSSIVVSLCKQQIETVLRFFEAISSVMVMRSNLHLRPLTRPPQESKNAKAAWWKSWWKYVIMAVIEKNRSQNSIFKSFDKYFVIRKYIKLYKRVKKFVDKALI